MNEKNVAKYLEFCATVELILLASLSPSLYIVESGFNHVHYLQSKQISTLNIECCNFRLKLTNL